MLQTPVLLVMKLAKLVLMLLLLNVKLVGLMVLEELLPELLVLPQMEKLSLFQE